MTNANRTVLIVVLLLALAGVAAFLLVDRGPGAASAVVGPGVRPTGMPVQAEQGPSLAEARGPQVPQQAAAARQDLAQAVEQDPFAAARCGFRGRLLLPTNEPAPDIEVRIFRFGIEMLPTEGLIPERREPPKIDVEAGTATSSEDGRFLVEGVWPRGMYVLSAGAGTDTPLWQLVERTPGPGEIVDLGDLVLQAMGTIAGTVVDDSGEGLPGAMVRAADVPGELLALAPLERFHPEGAVIVRDGDPGMVIAMPAWVTQRFRDLPIPTTFTDADGSFVLKGVIPGANVLVVTALGFRGHVESNVEVQAGATYEAGEIELDLGELIGGRVVDGAGEPVAGAQVLLGESIGAIPIELAGPPLEADGDGHFARSGYASRHIGAAARRSGGDPWTVFPQEFVARELVLTLPSAHSLRVHLSSRLGRAIEGPRLRLLQRPEDSNARETLNMAAMGFLPDLEIDTRLRRSEDGAFVLSEIASGSYLLLAESEGHAVAAESFELDSDRDVILSLEASRALFVRVVDGAGEPIPRAEILAAPTGQNVKLRHGPLPCGRTGPDGTLIVTQVQADEVNVTARHPAYGSVRQQVNSALAEAVLVLLAPGSLEGTLTEAGQPPTPGKWLLSITRNGPEEQMPVFAVANLEGRFQAGGLQPGSYTLTVIPSLGGLSSVGGLMGFMQRAFAFGDSVQESFEILSGEQTLLALDALEKAPVLGPAANVSGTVLVDGRPGVGLHIGGWARPVEAGSWRRFSAEVDPSGRFDVGRVPAGRINLTLSDPSAGRGLFAAESINLWSENVELVADEDREFAIELITGSLVGTILEIDGSPAHGCRVSLQGASSQSTLTDENGRFRLSRLPAGTYVLEARGARGARAERRGIEITASGTPTSVELRLERTFSVRGRVDLAAFGERPEWLWMSAMVLSEDAEPTRRPGFGSQVARDGSFTLDALLPGRYTVQFHLQSPHAWHIERPFEVRSSDIDDLVLVPVQREIAPKQAAGN